MLAGNALQLFYPLFSRPSGSSGFSSSKKSSPGKEMRAFLLSMPLFCVVTPLRFFRRLLFFFVAAAAFFLSPTPPAFVAAAACYFRIGGVRRVTRQMPTGDRSSHANGGSLVPLAEYLGKQKIDVQRNP